jgi:hypothetical protein
MARIPEAIMKKRVAALQVIMESHPEGMTVNELVSALSTGGEELPKSQYQAVSNILKKAEKNGSAVKKEGKWRLLEEDEETTEPSTESQE